MDTIQEKIDVDRSSRRAALLASDIRIAERCVRRGDVPALAHLLQDQRALARLEELGTKADQEVFARSEEWIRVARVHEAEHGRGSMLDRTDPFVRDVLIPMARRFGLDGD